MDETLVAARFEHSLPEGFKSNFSYDFHGTKIHVRTRPYLEECLQRLSGMYEMVVFTAGQKDYADPILDYIDENKTLFKKRLYRDDCVAIEKMYYIKDLDIFLDRLKKDMIIVDNSIMSFAFDLQNGVPIKSFMGNEQDDRELLFLISFLEEAFAIDDIQQHISDSFKLPSMLKAVLQEDD
eukprot:CAMPEP_0202960876 /NCGR_PEP_ID=MMETSP1396-20130829/5019_1 /ASSEMBLY_ACC=CAM_ASM_000872 /TAXON_ID= /ORGANISM="Pseudokeronopsis sp., Strain Brazil" /LENGTH=180 /DNA_ID=CAMNT_0049680381 /DNA_START=609 /DNA_END=1151 /DNA_ORIENTATION=-